MIQISIPDFNDNLSLEHLVLDYNGTLAVDGKVLPQIIELLNKLSEKLTVHIITADTFQKAKDELEGCPYELVILSSDKQANHKLDFIHKLGADKVVSIGNGRNDQLMLKASGIGMAVICTEGASYAALLSADIICNSINDALELLLNPLRIIATLRN